MIERLTLPPADVDVRGLAELLVDAVASGASVSFMEGLDVAAATEWWRESLAGAPSRTIVLVARDEHGIVGTVQVRPAWAPNQPHRGDVAKLIVHRRARGRGLGAALMTRAEEEARDGGYTLLVLDTVRGESAERLYERGGWTRVGVIPNYALEPRGTLCDTVVFYKFLGVPSVPRSSSG